jgi:hypothetical protein
MTPVQLVSTSPDPFGRSGSKVIDFNPYAYVANNFVTLIDPSGFDWDWPSFDWSFGPLPYDPLPPFLLPSQPGVANGSGPVTGSGNLSPGPRPYNPVDEVGNRAAAARVDYQTSYQPATIGSWQIHLNSFLKSTTKGTGGNLALNPSIIAGAITETGN